MTRIEDRHAAMIPAKGFDAAFDELRKDITYRNGEEAFNYLNEEYKKAFGTYRYASYPSYKSSRSQRENPQP